MGDEALSAALRYDKVVVFAGLPASMESEGVDSTHMRLPEEQDAFISKLCKAHSYVAVVLHNGSPVEIKWVNGVSAILEMYLGGEDVGEAAYRLLYGDANPSGKLAETFPKKLEHNPAYLNYPGYNHSVEYKEGVFVGYRYYDTKNMEVLFPFGHGLSYTSFEYSELSFDKTELTDKDELRVSVKVKNTGSVAGKEAVQLYVRDPVCEVQRPVRELKGFEKVSLEPGEEKTLQFTLNKRSFAYWNTVLGDWYVESGEFIIEIGASSRDIRLCSSVTVTSDVEIPYVFTEYSSLGEVMRTRKGGAVLKPIIKPMLDAMSGGVGNTSDAMGEGAEEMMAAMLDSMPLSTLVTFGIITREQMNGILKAVNP